MALLDVHADDLDVMFSAPWAKANIHYTRLRLRSGMMAQIGGGGGFYRFRKYGRANGD